MDDIKKFPWMASVHQAFSKTFNTDYNTEALLLLDKNLRNELQQALKKDEECLKNLFTCIRHFYSHFCWKINWKTDCSPHMKISCTKILSALIQTGIILSKGELTSEWINNILAAMRLFPGSFDLLCDALLLINNLKKSYYEVFALILKHFLFTNKLDVKETSTYFKTLLLLRRLKMLTKEKLEKAKVVSLASGIKVPSDCSSWLSAHRISHLKKVNDKIRKQFLGKKLPAIFFEQLRKILQHKLSFEGDPVMQANSFGDITQNSFEIDSQNLAATAEDLSEVLGFKETSKGSKFHNVSKLVDTKISSLNSENHLPHPKRRKLNHLLPANSKHSSVSESGPEFWNTLSSKENSFERSTDVEVETNSSPLATFEIDVIGNTKDAHQIPILYMTNKMLESVEIVSGEEDNERATMTSCSEIENQNSILSNSDHLETIAVVDVERDESVVISENMYSDSHIESISTLEEYVSEKTFAESGTTMISAEKIEEVSSFEDEISLQMNTESNVSGSYDFNIETNISINKNDTTLISNEENENSSKSNEDVVLMEMDTKLSVSSDLIKMENESGDQKTYSTKKEISVISEEKENKSELYEEKESNNEVYESNYELDKEKEIDKELNEEKESNANIEGKNAFNEENESKNAFNEEKESNNENESKNAFDEENQTNNELEELKINNNEVQSSNLLLDNSMENNINMSEFIDKTEVISDEVKYVSKDISPIKIINDINNLCDTKSKIENFKCNFDEPLTLEKSVSEASMQTKHDEISTNSTLKDDANEIVELKELYKTECNSGEVSIQAGIEKQESAPKEHCEIEADCIAVLLEVEENIKKPEDLLMEEEGNIKKTEDILMEVEENIKKPDSISKEISIENNCSTKVNREVTYLSAELTVSSISQISDSNKVEKHIDLSMNLVNNIANIIDSDYSPGKESSKTYLTPKSSQDSNNIDDIHENHSSQSLNRLGNKADSSNESQLDSTLHDCVSNPDTTTSGETLNKRGSLNKSSMSKICGKEGSEVVGEYIENVLNKLVNKVANRMDNAVEKSSFETLREKILKEDLTPCKSLSNIYKSTFSKENSIAQYDCDIFSSEKVSNFLTFRDISSESESDNLNCSLYNDIKDREIQRYRESLHEFKDNMSDNTISESNKMEEESLSEEQSEFSESYIDSTDDEMQLDDSFQCAEELKAGDSSYAEVPNLNPKEAPTNFEEQTCAVPSDKTLTNLSESETEITTLETIDLKSQDMTDNQKEMKSFTLDEAESFITSQPNLTINIGKRCDRENSDIKLDTEISEIFPPVKEIENAKGKSDNTEGESESIDKLRTVQENDEDSSNIPEMKCPQGLFQYVTSDNHNSADSQEKTKVSDVLSPHPNPQQCINKSHQMNLHQTTTPKKTLVCESDSDAVSIKSPENIQIFKSPVQLKELSVQLELLPISPGKLSVSEDIPKPTRRVLRKRPSTEQTESETFQSVKIPKKRTTSRKLRSQDSKLNLSDDFDQLTLDSLIHKPSERLQDLPVIKEQESVMMPNQALEKSELKPKVSRSKVSNTLKTEEQKSSKGYNLRSKRSLILPSRLKISK